MADKPTAPEFLADEGQRIWSEIVDIYDLRPDELLTLEDFCALADEIAELRAAWSEEGKPRTTKGSMGQLVEHPTPKRITDLRMKRNTLAKQLNLPDVDEAAGAPVNQQRDAANAKWATGKGRGA